MSNARQRMIDLIEQGVIPPNQVDQALTATGVYPGKQSWRCFVERLLLWLATLALAMSVLFFVAYNWNELGRFAQFAGVQFLLVAAISGFCLFGKRVLVGQVALMSASIFLGVLLALYGQTYQTGADPWQLFCTWALLLMPWAVIGRLPALWVLWLALINLSVLLYYDVSTGLMAQLFWGRNSFGPYALIAAVNVSALIIWEIAAIRLPWLSVRWAPRLIALASGYAITMPALLVALTADDYGYELVAWAAWLGLIYWVYRHWVPDLFMLAGGCLSLVIVVVCLLAPAFLDAIDGAGFLLLMVIVIALGAGLTTWLKSVYKEQQS